MSCSGACVLIGVVIKHVIDDILWDDTQDTVIVRDIFDERPITDVLIELPHVAGPEEPSDFNLGVIPVFLRDKVLDDRFHFSSSFLVYRGTLSNRLLNKDGGCHLHTPKECR